MKIDISLSNDEYFMEIALKEAEKANKNLEIPVGSVIISKDMVILSKAYNQTEKKHSQIFHAEAIAIEKANKKLQDWRLQDCTIYVTLQPCWMCMGLICLSRIKRLVYGAKSPLFGFCIDNQNCPSLYKKHIKNITTGILEEKASSMLKKFFRNKRKKGE